MQRLHEGNALLQLIDRLAGSFLTRDEQWRYLNDGILTDDNPDVLADDNGDVLTDNTGG